MPRSGGCMSRTTPSSLTLLLVGSCRAPRFLGDLGIIIGSSDSSTIIIVSLVSITISTITSTIATIVKLFAMRTGRGS